MVYTSEHPPFAVTADVVVLAGSATGLQVLLVTRGSKPYSGKLALPGGFVDPDEDLGDAARRELMEETAVSMPEVELVQLGAYGKPGRDPRMRTVSVAYLLRLPALVAPTAGDDASDADWHPVADVLEHPERLAFDHAQVLNDAVAYVTAC